MARSARLSEQRLLKYAHGAAAAGWAVAGVVGATRGWASSIPFLYFASVWANVAAHLSGISGERPDQQVLERLAAVERLLQEQDDHQQRQPRGDRPA